MATSYPITIVISPYSVASYIDGRPVKPVKAVPWITVAAVTMKTGTMAVTHVVSVPVARISESGTAECDRCNSQEKYTHSDANQSLHRPTPSVLM